MEGNIIQLMSSLLHANNMVTEYRSASGIGIIRWCLPDQDYIRSITDADINGVELDKLYQRLQKDFLARSFIDLDLFVLPNDAAWLNGLDDDLYSLPKGRSKVRIDDVDGGKVLICQWHLPSHLVEYFTSNDTSFDEHWDREQLDEVIVDYLNIR